MHPKDIMARGMSLCGWAAMSKSLYFLKYRDRRSVALMRDARVSLDDLFVFFDGDTGL